jgi:hypothetical protein
MIYRITMLHCEQDLFDIIFFCNIHYDIVLTYVTLILSFLNIYPPHQHFCGPMVNDT